MFPLISVVIPVYNAERVLEKTLQSIILQKGFEKSEVVLIDDGSTDRSYEICRQYSEIHRNIKVHHVDNNGVSHARNIGKLYAQGEYIWFVDADDYISDGAFEELYNVIFEKKYDLIFFNNIFEQVDGTVISYPIKNIKENLEYSQNEIKNTIIPWILGYTEKQSCVFEHAKQIGAVTYSDCYNAPWQALYRRQFVETIKFDENLKIYEDLLFNFKVLLSAGSLYYIEKPLYHYVSNANGLATKYHRDYAKMKLYLYHEMVRIMSEAGISDKVSKLITYRIQSDFISIFVNESKNRNGDAVKIIKNFYADPLVKQALALHGEKRYSYCVLLWLIRHRFYAIALRIVSMRTGGIK